MSFHTNYSVLSRFRHVILSMASGAILALALPKPGLWVFAWVGLVPLFMALRDASVPRAALCGLLTGIVYYGIILHWITLFGALPWMLLVVYEALYIAVFAALFVRLMPGRIGWLGFVAVPAAWVTLQFVRTLSPYAFIWGSFAHTQAGNLPVAQIASLTGPWGIDFAVCFVNLALAVAITRRERRLAPVIAAALLTLGICIFGLVTMQGARLTNRANCVAVIQGNVKDDFHPVPNYDQRAYQTYSRLSLAAAKAKPDIILWPETALPVDLTKPGWDDSLEPLAKRVRADLLVGGYDPSAHGSYNALHLYNANGKKSGVYRKVRLVPFGEFVPLRDRLPFVNNYGIRPEDVLAADRHALLDSRIGKIGVSICFESIFPQIARTQARNGAELLCVVTNDAWFEHSQAARQHLMMARLRAIENRRFLLRAAGTGISAVIDPFGRTRHEIGLFQQGIIIDRVSPSRHLTLYTRYGDWLAYLCIAITVICLFAPICASKKSSRGEHLRES